MNPKTWTNDNRHIVWTVSLDVPDTYCLYIGGQLYSENMPFEIFYPLYKNAVDGKLPS